MALRVLRSPGGRRSLPAWKARGRKAAEGAMASRAIRKRQGDPLGNPLSSVKRPEAQNLKNA